MGNLRWSLQALPYWCEFVTGLSFRMQCLIRQSSHSNNSTQYLAQRTGIVRKLSPAVTHHFVKIFIAGLLESAN